MTTLQPLVGLAETAYEAQGSPRAGVRSVGGWWGDGEVVRGVGTGYRVDENMRTTMVLVSCQLLDEGLATTTLSE